MVQGSSPTVREGVTPPSFPENVTAFRPGDGDPRQVRPTLPTLRRKDPTHPLRVKRNQLLSGLPNRRQAACRSLPISTPARRLAPLRRPTRKPHPAIAVTHKINFCQRPLLGVRRPGAALVQP